MLNCNFYRGLTRKTFSLDGNDTLSQVRIKLGSFMASSDLFTYYDTRQQLYLMQTKNTESRYKLPSILSPKKTATIIDPNKPVPDLEGLKVSSFSDRYLNVSVVLNNGNNDARAANNGKFQPVLLEKVQTINKAGSRFPNVYWNYAVICEKGSVIAFNYSCWGAAGYGYSIKSDRQTIVKDLFMTNDGRYGSVTHGHMARYESHQQNIVVDSLSDQGIPLDNRLQYSSVTFKTWNVKSYKRGDKTYSSNLAPGDSAIRGQSLRTGSIVSGGGIESGSPRPGGKSTQTIGKISHIRDDRNTVLGQIDIYFLVFKNKAAADQMIQQNQ